ncbi:CehA/McbA family metallohydrolase [Pelomonas sp. Root1217]|uniref:CehA/McbA family metallohydrolase n=1 Tax=Pelomonas sp. Root1217 TaxID=1736430 RepID=UPI000ABF6E18|nr:CehA/McbA family metallohydrolase [Pelomonas sp. Root1217]
MTLARHLPPTLLLLLLAACGGGSSDPQAVQASQAESDLNKAAAVRPRAKDPDHHEFSATLSAPFAVTAASGERVFIVQMDHPGIADGQAFAWALSLIDEQGRVRQRWSGESRYAGAPVTANVRWTGRGTGGAALVDGLYQLKLEAASLDAATALSQGATTGRAERLLAAAAPLDHAEQQWPVALGQPANVDLPPYAAMPTAAGRGLVKAQSAPAINSLPYTVYYANLHSQTNDSDGGGALSNCSSSQPAQTGAYGPADAFAYGKTAGLDILMSSEHNHYFDGSSSTNASGSAATAKSRYQAGLSAATAATTANYLAIYGMEWGVISNGGHMNIFNSTELFAWEYNSSNQLFGDRFTAKSDYAALYATMRQLGLVGQFNHPDTAGQFLVGGTALGYSADGDEVMVLTEILNSSAFSSNTTETETGLSNFEDAFNKMLERGFHVAPASNQDNHCANWGKSYTNRTGVLIPNGTALGKTSFIDAIKARRVFATMDKTAQIVLTANGHVMGERFTNSGTLSLSVGYASNSGKTAASVQIYEGVPKRNGTVTLLASSATASTTPAVGEHFYYAKITQNDGKMLWTAPVWVTQSNGPVDTTPPTGTASESGTAGTITLSATASDNVGVARVDFVVDGVVKGSDTSSPYSMTLDSTLLANGSHSLVARAYDAAGNSGASTAVAFSISNASATLNETESNGTIATANVVANQTTISGTMATTSDKDYFKVTLAAGKTLRVDMSCPAAYDYDLYLHNVSGTTLTSSESATCTESLSYKNTSSSALAVYIRVGAYSGSSSTQGYTLTLSFP